MKLNCDMGESFGAWPMGQDELVMPYIDQSNIACGYHAGDPMVMAKTLQLAKQHRVSIGAHPSYPDLNGFGRRSIKMSADELTHILHYQIAALAGMALTQGLTIDFVKPHGALYNDMMASKPLRLTIMQAIASYPLELKLMILATADYKAHQIEANELGISLLFEAFVDRCYTDEGNLVSRQQPHAVHDAEHMLQQANQLIHSQSITTENGLILNFPIDTLCVHGDNETAIQHIKEIRQLIDEH